MGMNIEDGTGTGYQASVNNKNMIAVSAVIRTGNFYANHLGNFYSSTITVTPSANGCFYYLKNTGEKDLVIQRLSIHVASNEIIKGYLNDIGTPVDGSSYIPINRNGGSNKLCDCTIEYGIDITGLSAGDHFDSFYAPADNKTHTYRWEAGVMIPKNRTFTLYVVNGGIEINFSVTAFCCSEL